MNTMRFAALAALLMLLVAPAQRAAGDLFALSAQQPVELEALIRGRVETLRSTGSAGAAGETVIAHNAVSSFYEARAFQPAWTVSALQGLAEAFEWIDDHGLDAADYHRAAIFDLWEVRTAGRATVSERADLDLLATDAFVLLGSHLLHGRVNPETINPEWLANRRNGAMHDVLAQALEEGDIEGALADLAPSQPRYQSMIGIYRHLREVSAAGGWPVVPDGPKLEVGSTGERVEALAGRLAASGDLPPEAVGSEFGLELEIAVRTFQTPHRLTADGVVGAGTIAALNVPAEERARQVVANLERWRWLPTDLGARHIEVNIAGFDVKVVEAGRTVRVHRAVVGRHYRQTPMFSGSMTYLVLAPYWHVPPTIAAVDKLPEIKADVGYLARQQMILIDQRTNERVDPTTVEWADISRSEFNRLYRIRQDPGPMNALGGVKFMFPNRYNVYLHDTPTRELFRQESRAFSSGCVRTEDPLDLAEYLLRDQPQWSRSAIEAAIARGVEQTVRLAEPVPVHLLYWTVWADANGLIHYRPDVYGRDEAVREALAASPPGV